MPNIESEQNHLGNNKKESLNLISDTYNFADHIRPDIEGRLRQLNLVGYGTVAGGIKDIPNEFFNHPWETIGKLSVAGAIGTGLGAALAADSPIIVGGATAASIALTAASLWHTSVKFFSNKKLMHSLDAVYKSGDKHTIDTSQKVAANIIGPEAFDYGLGIAGGFAGLKLSEKLPLNSVTEPLKGFIPVAFTMSDDPVRMTFADGSQIHIHGNQPRQAIYEKDGKEYELKINNNGIDMSVLGSLAGHQMLKGTRNRPRDIDNAIKVDIDPKKQETKIVTDIPASYEGPKHDLANGAGWFLNSCKQCKIEQDAIDRALEEPPIKSDEFTENGLAEKSTKEADEK